VAVVFGFSVLASVLFLFSHLTGLGFFLVAELLLVISNALFLSFLIFSVFSGLLFRAKLLKLNVR
jgi:hypothetical protein